MANISDYITQTEPLFLGDHQKREWLFAHMMSKNHFRKILLKLHSEGYTIISSIIFMFYSIHAWTWRVDQVKLKLKRLIKDTITKKKK